MIHLLRGLCNTNGVARLTHYDPFKHIAHYSLVFSRWPYINYHNWIVSIMVANMPMNKEQSGYNEKKRDTKYICNQCYFTSWNISGGHCRRACIFIEQDTLGVNNLRITRYYYDTYCCSCWGKYNNLKYKYTHASRQKMD